MKPKSWLLLLCIVFLSYPTAAWSAGAQREKEIERLNGTVDYRTQAANRWDAVFSSAPVGDNDYARTHDNSLGRLSFHGGKQIATLYERTVVQVGEVSPDKVSLIQLFGRLKTEVRHYFQRPTPVQITTPTAVIAVKGSAADTLVLLDHTTFVTAGAGTVTVTSSGQTVTLTQGESAIIHPGAMPVPLGANVSVFRDAHGNVFKSNIDAVRDSNQVSTDPSRDITSDDLFSGHAAYAVNQNNPSWGVYEVLGSSPAPQPSSATSNNTGGSGTTSNSPSGNTTNTASQISVPQTLQAFTGTASPSISFYGFTVGNGGGGSIFGFNDGHLSSSPGISGGQYTNGKTQNGAVITQGGSDNAIFSVASRLSGKLNGDGTYSGTYQQVAPLPCSSGCSGSYSTSTPVTMQSPTLFSATSSSSGQSIYGFATIPSTSGTSNPGIALMVVADSSGDVTGVSLMQLNQSRAFTGWSSATSDYGYSSGGKSTSVFLPTFNTDSGDSSTVLTSLAGQNFDASTGSGSSERAPIVASDSFTGALSGSTSSFGLITGSFKNTSGSDHGTFSGTFFGNSTLGVFTVMGGSSVNSNGFGVGGGYVKSTAMHGLLFVPQQTTTTSNQNLILTATFSGDSNQGSFNGTTYEIGNPGKTNVVYGTVYGTNGQLP